MQTTTDSRHGNLTDLTPRQRSEIESLLDLHPDLYVREVVLTGLRDLSADVTFGLAPVDPGNPDPRLVRLRLDGGGWAIRLGMPATPLVQVPNRLWDWMRGDRAHPYAV